MNNVGKFINKSSDAQRFVVKNVAPNNKTVRVFNTPIRNMDTYDLLSVPGICEEDIRHSALKGELKVKFIYQELIVVDSDIQNIMFNDEHKAFLQSIGITNGLEVTGIGGGDLTEEQHKTILQLIHLADGDGPMEGFSGAYRETLPVADPFPTQIIWYTDSLKTGKIIEKNITYDGERRIIRTIQNLYDTDGVSLLATVRDNITYQGPFETTRTRTVV